MKDIYADFKDVLSINSIVGNNSTEGKGVGVDTQFCEGAEAIFNIGVSLDTLSGSVYVTLSLQHCDTDTDGSYVDVPSGEYKGSQGLVINDPAEDALIVKVGYTGTKRWLRAIVAFTGTHTNGFPIGATIRLGHPRHAPLSA